MECGIGGKRKRDRYRNIRWMDGVLKDVKFLKINHNDDNVSSYKPGAYLVNTIYQIIESINSNRKYFWRILIVDSSNSCEEI